MAGRNQKTSFEFFRLDTNFFANKKIKALRRAYGAIGILTYIYILCYTYGNDGFYIHFEDREQFAYDIAESISGEQISKVATRVNESISYLSVLGLIDKDSLERNTITGVNIQRQYIEMGVAAKRKIDKDKLFLLSDVDFTEPQNDIYSEEKAIYSEEITNNSEEMQQSKVKGSKDISTTNNAREIDGFLKKYGVEIDNYSDRITELDFSVLDKAFSESKWLRENIHSMSRICEIYPKIHAGYYKDFSKGEEVKPFHSREYSREELDSWNDNIDDLEW